MSKRKIIAIILVCLLTIGGTIGGLVYYLTSGVADEASAFFQTIATDGPEAGYRRSSPALQRSTNEADFIAYVERFGLRQFKSASWPNREMTLGQATVKGTLTLEGAGTVPATVVLTKDDAGAWRVISVDIAPAGVKAEPAPKAEAPPAPSPAPQFDRTPAGTDDRFAAKLGDVDWSVSAKDVLTLAFGDSFRVIATAITEPTPGGVDLTSVTLSFKNVVGAPQTLGRSCEAQNPCIELSRGGNQYKLDKDPGASGTLTLTRAENGVIEGVFSADMVSLDGKLKISDGRFQISPKPPATK